MSKRDRSANLVNWEIHFTAQELRKNKSFLAHTPTPSFLVRGDHNEIYQSPSPGPRVSEAIGGKGVHVIRVYCSFSVSAVVWLAVYSLFCHKNAPSPIAPEKGHQAN